MSTSTLFSDLFQVPRRDESTISIETRSDTRRTYIHIRTHSYVTRSKGGRPVPPPADSAAGELNSHPHVSSKRKEGDVTSRLRRIKRVNYMNRRARRWRQTHTRAPAHVYRPDSSRLSSSCPRSGRLSVIARRPDSRLCSRDFGFRLAFNPFGHR